MKGFSREHRSQRLALVDETLGTREQVIRYFGVLFWLKQAEMYVELCSYLDHMNNNINLPLPLFQFYMFHIYCS